jgi:hypothetical protein
MAENQQSGDLLERHALSHTMIKPLHKYPSQRLEADLAIHNILELAYIMSW